MYVLTVILYLFIIFIFLIYMYYLNQNYSSVTRLSNALAYISDSLTLKHFFLQNPWNLFRSVEKSISILRNFATAALLNCEPANPINMTTRNNCYD